MLPNRPAVMLPLPRSVTRLNSTQRDRSPDVGPSAGVLYRSPSIANLQAALASESSSQLPSAQPPPSRLACTMEESADAMREVHGNNAEETSILSVISRNHLECPVCLDAIRTKPIYQCKNGHTICDVCIRQLNSCPLCRCCILGGRIRNRALEALMDHIKVTCPYRRHGCTQMVKSGDVREHMLNCAFGKFILCPSLGFDSCQASICYENWTEHLKNAHKLNVLQGRYPSVYVTYSEFMSTKTLKDASSVKWESIILTPFPEAGPFLILCELDVLNSCTANFVCIYAPPKPITPVEEENEPSNRYHVQFSISEATNGSAAWLPAKFTWQGVSMLYSEYKSGCKNGVFTIPLSQYRLSDDAVPEPPPNIPRDPDAIPEGAENVRPRDLLLAGQRPIIRGDGGELGHPTAHGVPNVLRPLILQYDAFGNNPGAQGGGQNERPNAAPAVPPAPRRRPRSIKQDLLLKIRIAKTAEELDSPLPAGQSTTFMTIINNTPVKTVKYPRIKCDGCKMMPVRGIRYKCVQCPRYELCPLCYDVKESHHQNNHIFLKIENLEQNAMIPPLNGFRRICEQFVDENGIIPPPAPKRSRTTKRPPANRTIAGGPSTATSTTTAATGNTPASSSTPATSYDCNGHGTPPPAPPC